MSIIIPVYNVAPYIQECIKSVIDQSYAGETECLLIDDCGEDDSMSIAERLVEEYDGAIHFRIFRHSQNRGLSAARNTGIREAKGDYIYFLDSDDYLTEDCIAVLMSKVEEDPSIELVQGNAESIPKLKFESFTRKISLVHAKNNDEVRSCVVKYDQMPGFSWNKLVKRSFVEEHQLWFREGILYEDGLWRFYLLKYLSNVYFVSDITYIYRLRPDSITSATDNHKKALNRRIVCHEFLTNLTPKHEKEEYNLYAKEFAKYLASFSYTDSGMKKEFLHYWEKGKMYGKPDVMVYLAVNYMLGITRLGRLANPILFRLKYPMYIVRDIRRISDYVLKSEKRKKVG